MTDLSESTPAIDRIKKLGSRRGISDDAMRKWFERGSVPGRWHLPLLEEAQIAGVELSPSDLLSATSRK